MGSTNGITRGQLRPHFSGRSPPFLLAALCVGLGILGVSYWSLSQQYNDLEEQLKKTLIKKDSIENDLDFVQNQLNSREKEFNLARQTNLKTDDKLKTANNQMKAQSDQINDLNTKIQTITKDIAKCNEELNQKSNDLGDAVSKLQDIEKQKDVNKDRTQELSELRIENKRLELELQTLKQESVVPKNNTSVDSDPKPVAEETPENNKNDLNSLKANNSVNAAVSPLDDTKVKLPESVIAEPIKPNESFPSNDLAEEDRKEDSLVEANVNNNEVADEFNRESEGFKFRPQI